jgi:hypothetical protein
MARILELPRGTSCSLHLTLYFRFYNLQRVSSSSENILILLASAQTTNLASISIVHGPGGLKFVSSMIKAYLCH